MRRQLAQHRRQRTFGLRPANKQRRRLDRLRFGAAVGSPSFAGLPDQGESIVAELLLLSGWQTRPRAVALDHVEEKLQGAIDIAALDFLGQRRGPRRLWRWTGRRGRIERAIQFAAWLRQDQLAQQLGPLPGNPEGYVPTP